MANPDPARRAPWRVLQVTSLAAIVILLVSGVSVPFIVWTFLGAALLGADPHQLVEILDALQSLVRRNGSGRNGNGNG